MWSADFVKPGQIEFRGDATAPEPATGEVVIAVESCGICGSDVQMFRNNAHRDIGTRQTPEGYCVPGHEFAGTISVLGEGVNAWSVGDRVVGVTSCGGGMAEYVAVPDNPFQLVKVPDGVSFSEAATTEPLADGLQMVRKAKAQPGENVVVFGVGIIGLGVVQGFHNSGVELGSLIAIDVNDARLEKARELGATDVINPNNGDIFEQIAAITGKSRHWAGVESANIDIVVDCAGYSKHFKGPAPLETALQLASLQNARIICFGSHDTAMTANMESLIFKESHIMGSMGYAAEELVQALELMRDGKAKRMDLISHQFPLEQIQQAYEAQGGPDALKVVINVREQKACQAS